MALILAQYCKNAFSRGIFSRCKHFFANNLQISLLKETGTNNNFQMMKIIHIFVFSYMIVLYDNEIPSQAFP
jgi:hypothetical protein